MVRLAKYGLISLRSSGWSRSVRTVSSTRGRPFSPAAISAAPICPLSIMAAATVIALRKPRQALERSKICIPAGSPSWRWAKEALAGSSMSRETAAWMKRPIASGGTAD
jgi:hypothetical protein